MEDSLLSEPRSGVEISITSPSRNTSEDEFEEEFIPRALLKSNKRKESSESNRDDNLNGKNSVYVNGEASGGENLSEELERRLSLENKETKEDDDDDDDEHVNGEEKERKGEESEEKPANLEMIGDRVLIERDGKFELVDVSEIKAEYFEMLGLSPGEKKTEATDEINGVANGEEKSGDGSKKPEEKPPVSRPKTTANSDYGRRKNHRNSTSPERRSASAKLSSRNDDYAHIKSVYGMTEEQLKIKRRREEAIAKRKKEERQREEEEIRRKREDAERAFQAWLAAKLEEARERKRQEALNKPDQSLQERKSEEAQRAYDDWLASKRQQYKVAKEYEERKQSEVASQFIIRDRQLCDEAFRRWLKKKRAEAKAKEKLKRKKRSKPKLKKKEPLPLNSKNITYLEYYGYRNHVVL